MNITIRLETPADYRETEFLTREAFWDLYKPGCDEHLVLHNIRNVPAFIKELNFVACDGTKVVGNIIYTEAKVIDDKNRESIVLCMGPVGVLPEYQKKGIGSMLMKESIEKARSLKYKGVVIFGNPAYYHRFGFKNAENYGIQTSDGQNFDPFMALELFPGSLKGITGKFFEDPAFKTDELELEQFEKGFPYREKHVTDTQLKL
jgi:predicted N-acetyltransferase YhbS